MVSTEVVQRDAAGIIAWDDEARALLRAQIYPTGTDAEIALAFEVCRRTGLDPWANQIYFIPRFNKKAGRDVMSIQTSIDGYRLTAQRTGRYNGQTRPEWYDGATWTDVWLSKDNPLAARIGVFIKDAAEPTYGIATWQEYAQTYKDGNPSGQWATMPATMLVKCAEAQALRKAFPAELSGIYTREEMHAAPEPVEQALTRDQWERVYSLALEVGNPTPIAKAKTDQVTPATYERVVAKFELQLQEQAEAALEGEIVAESDADAEIML